MCNVRICQAWHAEFHNITYGDCFPSGKFCVGFSDRPVEHATIIFASLPTFSSTPAQIKHKLLIIVPFKNNQTTITKFGSCYILCMNSGFSCVPANIPKNTNVAHLAIFHAVHSFINLNTWILTAPGG